MTKLVIGLPGLLSGVEQRINEVYIGCHIFLQGLGELEKCVKLIRVKFDTVDQSSRIGPKFHVIFEHPLGIECSYSTDFRFMGDEKKGTSENESPSHDDIANHLLEHVPSQIVEHLGRGATLLADAQVQYRRLSRGKMYCIEFVRSKSVEGQRPLHHFRANTEEEALRYVANHLGTLYPFSRKLFHERGGMRVYRDFITTIFPR